MILVGLGSNINGLWGSPQQTVERALQELNVRPCQLQRASSLSVTEPFGVTDQPQFVNAVAEIATQLSADELLKHLQSIENSAGRKRLKRWGPRSLDLDLLDFNGEIRTQIGDDIQKLILPHPGISERLFVLEPIAEIAPDWVHPLTGETARFTIQKRYNLNSI